MAAIPKVSVASLASPTKAGFLTKQGGSIKTWKRRWFVLKGDSLWYFKSQKEQEQTGCIKLEPTSVCQMEVAKKKKGATYFSVGTSKRTYLIYADSEQQAKEWVECISKAINEKRNGPASPTPPVDKEKTDTIKMDPIKKEDKEEKEKEKEKPVEVPISVSPNPTPEPPISAPVKKSKSSVSPRNLIFQAKSVISFLQEEDSKVLEFWQIWSESIPPVEELTAGMAIEYTVSTSANMQKLTWRTAGPQNVFIQKMVDFFWNVGAPETEIDRLNDVGALINPLKIGSWIDMSAKGGMDGGWYFPVDIPLKLAIEAADPGEPTKKLSEWSEKHQVDKCFAVGRDMGAAPPRQTEIRIKLPGHDFSSQLAIALSAYSMFGFPSIPDNAMQVLNESKPVGLCLSVITSSEGFVRLGLLAPKPSMDAVISLCAIAGANNEAIPGFEGHLGTEGPSFVEYQYLKEGFGYGVYKEGFDIVFHYAVGEETFEGA